MIETLVLDLGGVLMDHDDTQMAQYIPSWPHDLCAAYGRGEITTEVFLHGFSAALNVSEVRARGLWLSLHAGIPTERLDRLRSLRGRMPVFLLSNNDELHWQHVLDLYPDFCTLFDGIILSQKVGLEKPDIRIYEEANRIIRNWHGARGRVYKPENTLFLDDSKQNCAAALELGWQARPVYHVVGAVIEDRGEILCVQKTKTKYAYTSYKWEYPGGKVEPGETEPEALERELQEEMDYPIEVVGLLSRVDYLYPDFAVELHFYLCHPADQKNPRQFRLKEHAAARWTKPYDIPLLDWCEADHILPPEESIVDHFSGTEFQKAVWRALCRIPYGETRTYGEVARMAGFPRACRAVGHAVHCNPLCYYLPCHRVVTAQGGAGQYAYGTDVKLRLLRDEGRRALEEVNFL